MKKVFGVIMLSLVLVLSACSSNSGAKDERLLKDFIDAFVAAGVEVDPNEKPMFQAVGAKDGVIFYLDNAKVAIYEFESASELQKNKKENKLLSDWQENGKFLIETNKDEALKIFKDVE